MMSSEITHNRVGFYFLIVTALGAVLLVCYLLLTSPIGLLAEPLNQQNDIVLHNSGGLVCINHATAAELTVLKGIGETKAKAIVDFRTQHGQFNSIDEVMMVAGIGEGTFEEIKYDITV